MKLILRDTQSNKIYPLDKDVLNFGSNSAAHIQIEGLPDLAFQIRKEADSYSITNLSGLDFKLNQQKLSNQKLKSQDKLNYKDFEFEFQDPSKTLLKKNIIGDSKQSTQDLLKLFTLIINNPKFEDIPLEVLSLACQIMKADHGLLKFNDNEEYYPREKFNISRKAIEFASSQEEPFLWNHNENSELDNSKSIQQNQLTSILIYPFNKKQWFYLQRQASDFPFNDEDKKTFKEFGVLLKALILNAQLKNDQQNEISRLKEIHQRDSLIFQSQSMINVVNIAEKAAVQPIPILIRGETGTGKEQFAKLIHNASQRKDQAFIAVNCGAIPSNLIESVLFGHKKGSFTGASDNQLGLFEKANKGTIFLDEIGELDLQLQVRLLRVLQEKTINPIGSEREIKIDVRILSATHVNLEEAISQGSFREDLYFRLNVLSIELPPLRDRITDTSILADHFIKKYSNEFERSVPKLSSNSLKVLMQHKWPGNVRELENRIQKALILCDNIIEPSHMGFENNDSINAIYDLKSIREKAESKAIQSALREAKGNLSLAASMLNIDRKVLREHMERLHLKKEDFKSLN